jgi:ssDNA-binding Zn-finger/Zn-ribbon topoisomerase 1
MTNGKCTQCNSSNVYLSEESFEGAALVFRESGGDRISLECYVCLDCRYTAFYAKERTMAIFGKSKSLTELIAADPKRWKRVS